MRFDCAVFDMDGTLVDSAALWIEAKLDVLKRRGIPYTEADAAHLSSVELEGSAAYLQQHFLPEVSTAQLSREILDYADNFYAHTAALIPGAKELLEKLNALGIPCALATATPRERFEPLLRRLGVWHLLQHFVTVYEAKPSTSPISICGPSSFAAAPPPAPLCLKTPATASKLPKRPGFTLSPCASPPPTADRNTPPWPTCCWMISPSFPPIFGADRNSAQITHGGPRDIVQPYRNGPPSRSFA